MQITEYVIEFEDPAERWATVFGGTVDELPGWLESIVGDIRIARALAEKVRHSGDAQYTSDDPHDEPDLFGLTDDDMAELGGDLPTVDLLRVTKRTRKVSDAEGILHALHKINVHRAKIGQPSLDPVESNWSVEDVFKEAARLG